MKKVSCMRLSFLKQDKDVLNSIISAHIRCLIDAVNFVMNIPMVVTAILSPCICHTDSGRGVEWTLHTAVTL